MAQHNDNGQRCVASRWRHCCGNGSCSGVLTAGRGTKGAGKRRPQICCRHHRRRNRRPNSHCCDDKGDGHNNEALARTPPLPPPASLSAMSIPRRAERSLTSGYDAPSSLSSPSSLSQPPPSLAPPVPPPMMPLKLFPLLLRKRPRPLPPHSCWRGYKGIKTGCYQTSYEGLVCCGHGGPAHTYAGDQTKSTSTNQNGEQTCVKPGDLLGSKAAMENPWEQAFIPSLTFN